MPGEASSAQMDAIRAKSVPHTTGKSNEVRKEEARKRREKKRREAARRADALLAERARQEHADRVLAREASRPWPRDTLGQMEYVFGQPPEDDLTPQERAFRKALNDDPLKFKFEIDRLRAARDAAANPAALAKLDEKTEELIALCDKVLAELAAEVAALP